MSSRYSEMTKYAPNDSAAINQMTGSRHAALAGKLAAESSVPSATPDRMRRSPSTPVAYRLKPAPTS